MDLHGDFEQRSKVALDLFLMPPVMPPHQKLCRPCPESIGCELNVVKFSAYTWNVIYTRARLRLVHAINCRRGDA
jgi:hypothetical protein